MVKIVKDFNFHLMHLAEARRMEPAVKNRRANINLVNYFDKTCNLVKYFDFSAFFSSNSMDIH